MWRSTSGRSARTPAAPGCARSWRARSPSTTRSWCDHGRASGARLPARPRLHRRHDREAPAGLGAGRLGHDGPPAGQQARRSTPPSSSRSVSPARASGGGGAYDRFRERVIFPIRDANGQPVGLGGRILGTQGTGEDGVDRGPKYLNSPATPLFDKSRTLYLVDRAKAAMRKTGQAVIVEGYTDALMAHQAGFDNVVARLGTALTPARWRWSPATRRRSRSPTTWTRRARRPARSAPPRSRT